MTVVIDSSGRRRRRLPKASSLQHLIAPAILAVLIVSWETYSRARNTPNYVLPRPSRIATDGWEQRSELWRQLSHTLLEAAAGLSLAAVIGIAIALLLQRSRAIEFAILPWLIVFQAVPIVALTPILAVIIGRNTSTVVLVAAIVSFFAIIVNTLRGLRSVPDESLELFHVMAASPWETFRYLRLPGALPYVFTGFRVAASVVIPAAMVAEWIASDQGLGFYVVQQTALYRTELVWAGIVVATIAGIAVFAAVGLLERFIIPWHVEEPVR